MSAGIVMLICWVMTLCLFLSSRLLSVPGASAHTHLSSARALLSAGRPPHPGKPLLRPRGCLASAFPAGTSRPHPPVVGELPGHACPSTARGRAFFFKFSLEWEGVIH